MDFGIRQVLLVLGFLLAIVTSAASANTCSDRAVETLQMINIDKPYSAASNVLRSCKSNKNNAAVVTREILHLFINDKKLGGSAGNKAIKNCPKLVKPVLQNLKINGAKYISTNKLKAACEQGLGRRKVAVLVSIDNYVVDKKLGNSIFQTASSSAIQNSNSASTSSSAAGNGASVLSPYEMSLLNFGLDKMPQNLQNSVNTAIKAVRNCSNGCVIEVPETDAAIYITRVESKAQLFFHVPGEIEVEGGIFDLIGGKIGQVILARPLGSVKTIEDSDLPGRLGRDVKTHYDGVIRLDPGVQIITTMKLEGALPTALTMLGLPFNANDKYMVRVGRDQMDLTPTTDTPVNPATRSRSNAVTAPPPETDKAKPEVFNNYYAEIRLAEWDKPFGIEGATLYNAMVFYDTLGNLRLSGQLAMDNRDFYVFLEGPTSPANLKKLANKRDKSPPFTQMEFGIAGYKLTLQDIAKFSAAINQIVPATSGQSAMASKALSAAKLLPNDIVMVKNDEMRSFKFPNRDPDVNAANSSPLVLPPAKAFNLIALSSPDAKFEWKNDAGQTKRQRGPFLLAQGELEFLGQEFADANVLFSVTNGLTADASASLGITVGKVLGKNLGRIGFDPALKVRLNDQAYVNMNGTADMGVLGSRKLDVNVGVSGIDIKSGATCAFPFDIKMHVDEGSDLSSLMKSMGSFLPDGEKTAECVGEMFIAIADGVVYVFDGAGTAIASLAVDAFTDPAAAAKSIGKGVKIVEGGVADAANEVADIAELAGGEIGDALGAAGAEVIGGVSALGKSGIRAGSRAANKVGKAMKRAGKKIGCSIGIGSCKKRKRTPPGVAMNWHETNGIGTDVAVNDDEKVWLVRENSRLRFRDWKASSSSWTSVFSEAADGTELKNFKRLALGANGGLLAINHNDLYWSNGQISATSQKKVIFRRVMTQVHDVQVNGGHAWVLSTETQRGGYKIYQSEFNGSFDSLDLKRVQGTGSTGATAIDVDEDGEAWIVTDRYPGQFKRRVGNTWQNLDPLLSPEDLEDITVELITVDENKRPFVALDNGNLFGLTSHGWEQYKRTFKSILTRGDVIWAVGNGGKNRLYRTDLPDYIPPGDADDFRYGFESKLSEHCLSVPTRNLDSAGVVFRALEQANCSEPSDTKWDEPTNQQFYVQNVSGAGDNVRIFSALKGSNFCLGVQFGLDTDQAGVEFQPCESGNEAQHWSFDSGSTDVGFHQIKARHSDKCLEVANDSKKSGDPLVQATCHSTDAQQFEVGSIYKERLASGYSSRPTAIRQPQTQWKHVLQSRKANLCMSGNKKYSHAYAYGCNRSQAQQFLMPLATYKNKDGKYFKFKGVDSGKCLTPVTRESDGDVLLGHVACGEGAAQQWTIVPSTEGWFQVVNRSRNKCLFNEHAKGGDNARIKLVSCDDSGVHEHKFLWRFNASIYD